MTRAKAAAVIAALTNADYHARASQVADGSWEVIARSPSGMVAVDAVKTFADAQTVNAEVREVRFS
jgi:hypothetical protein